MTPVQAGTVLIVLAAIIGLIVLFSGSGTLTRMTTLGGIYVVCKPQGYDMVCAGDKAGKDGGLSCLPLKDVGGKCL